MTWNRPPPQRGPSRTIINTETTTTVRTDRRAYSPVLRQADLPTDTTVPWWHGRQLHFESTRERCGDLLAWKPALTIRARSRGLPGWFRFQGRPGSCTSVRAHTKIFVVPNPQPVAPAPSFTDPWAVVSAYYADVESQKLCRGVESA